MEDIVLNYENYENIQLALNDINTNINALTDFLELHFNNFALGIQFIMYVLGFFMFLKCLHLLYRLFGGVFLGGV